MNRDKIRLKNMRFFAYHGCRSEEKTDGQFFEIDVELSCDLQKAGLSDKLEQTHSFDEIYGIVSGAVTGTRYNLLEALAEELSDRLLDKYPDSELKLVIRKPKPPIDGEIDCVEIEVIRQR
ncbi:dihydroneopterin aldolase [bacterium]|nr:dihydroneopterin aldolase [bacterium]